LRKVVKVVKVTSAFCELFPHRLCRRRRRRTDIKTNTENTESKPRLSLRTPDLPPADRHLRWRNDGSAAPTSAAGRIEPQSDYDLLTHRRMKISPPRRQESVSFTFNVALSTFNFHSRTPRENGALIHKIRQIRQIRITLFCDS
jgi:hypothetical protein